MDESRIAGSITYSILAGRVNPVMDPDMEQALQQEGFRKVRGFWVKEFNLSEDKDPAFDEVWRAEMTHDGHLMFRSRWKNRSSWSGGLRKDMLPRSLQRFAARGQQVVRKDKDQMSDTGGGSKGRDREPDFRPPRDDTKDRYRTKRKEPSERDPDVDDDPDKKASMGLHPLDREVVSNWGFPIPEPNYHRGVFGALWHILETDRGISEKDFPGQDGIRATCDQVLRRAEAEEIIRRFEAQGQRPQFCAECVYSRLMR